MVLIFIQRRFLQMKYSCDEIVMVMLTRVVLKLLDNSKIRKKIRDIVVPNEECQSAVSVLPPVQSDNSEEDCEKNISRDKSYLSNLKDKEVTNLELEVSQLKEKLSTSQNDLANMQDRYNQANNQYLECRQQYKRVQDENKKLKNDHDELSNYLRNLENKYQVLEKSLSSCKYNLQNKEAELERQKDSFKELQSDYQILKEDLKQSKYQLQALQCDYRSLEAKFKQSENSLQVLQHNYRDLESKEKNAADSLRKVQAEAKQLKEHFSEPIEYLKKYRSLSEDVRTGLSDVICDKNEVLFIVSCSTSERLGAIWDYIKKALSDKARTEREICTLNEIFDYFFHIYNSSLSEPMYIRDNVDNGDPFDDDMHIRYPGSSTSGQISEVMLRGYHSKNTGKIIRPSLVRL